MIASLCALLLLMPAGSAGPPPSVQDDAKPTAEALYGLHCASCHGVSGDGKGTAELDRPARSFLDGGYSYGNTETAVLRSVVHGIPGTPMPAFGETLSAEQLKAVANYVIALGPPGTVVAPGSSVLVVKDRPVVVHGKMPALKEGGRPEPRSLIVGFPNGTTFQYRMQTGELQAIRQGDFLDRRDWGGRGGTALEPLGQVTWEPEPRPKEGMDKSQFNVVQDGQPLRRAFRGSRVSGDQVWLNFDVFDAEGNDVGGGQEFINFFMVDNVPVAMRACLVNGLRTELDVSGGTPVTKLELSEAENQSLTFSVHKLSAGLFSITSEDANTAVFVHANSWTESLENAIRADIQGVR